MRWKLTFGHSETDGPIPEEDYSDARIKHLEFVQAAINRMAANSFLFKGWAISLASGLAAFAAIESEEALLGIAISSTLLFWSLDGYYLWLERGFIARWAQVADRPSTEPVAFDMTPMTEGGFRGWLGTALRWHLVLLYGAIIVIDIIAIVYLKEQHHDAQGLLQL